MMKFSGLTFAPDFKMKSDKMFNKAQNAVDNRCIQIMEDYTPVAMEKYRNHGKMSRSHKQQTPGIIINTEPKARREYYTNKGFSGGKRGKYWFERMKLDRRGEILQAAKEAVK